MKRLRKVFFVFILAAGLSLAVFFVYKIYFKPHSAALVVYGNIEATTVNLSFQIPGLMVKRLARQGDLIKKGEVAALLDKSDLKKEVAEQKANVKAAKWALKELLRGSRSEDIAQARALERQKWFALKELLKGSRSEDIAKARAAAVQARVSMLRAESEYKREKQLYLQGFISAQDEINEKSSYRTAAMEYRQEMENYKEVLRGPRIEDIQQAEEALRQAKENLKEVLKGPRIEEIQQARARLKSAKALLAQAEINLGYATLRSPLSGVVLSRDSESGEYLYAGTPVVTAANLSHVWLRGYVDEKDLGKIKYHEPAEVTTDTYPGKVFKGWVAFISSEAEFTPKTVQTRRERATLVYRIRVDVKNPGFVLKPGMPAKAELY